MTERNRDSRTDMPLNPPDVPIEQKQRQLEGDRPRDEQAAYIDRSDTDDLGELTSTALDEGELAAGVDDDLPNGAETIEMLTELELRAEETDDPMEAVEEGFAYIPPIDPPTAPGETATFENARIASGLGVSSLDEPYDDDHHETFLPEDDEMSARVREALRADSSTTQYADRIAINARRGVVTLRGVVDDLMDSDNLLAVAEFVEGVEEVVDELEVRGIE